MKAKLQILTLVLLVLVIILFAITKIFIEPHDKIAKDIVIVNTILSGLWLAFTVVFVIIKGIGEKPIERIIKLVRELFVKTNFLIISIVVFLFINMTLSYQLLMYRQIEFISEEKVTLYESENVGDKKEIGIIPKNEPIKYRLKIGEKKLFYKSVQTGRTGSLKSFEIKFYSKEKIQIRIKKIPGYEKL